MTVTQFPFLYEVIVDIKQVEDEELHFIFANGKTAIFYHEQDCCESVYIESVVGDLDNLIGSPLILAEEVTDHVDRRDKEEDFYYEESCTYTFYKFATIKEYVDVTWCGESNGYYSESVDLKYDEDEED